MILTVENQASGQVENNMKKIIVYILLPFYFLGMVVFCVKENIKHENKRGIK